MVGALDARPIPTRSISACPSGSTARCSKTTSPAASRGRRRLCSWCPVGHDTRAIVDGLKAILNEGRLDPAFVSGPDEDVHSFVERKLIERIGDVGRRLHTGRSRNEQVSLDLRLYLRRRFAACRRTWLHSALRVQTRPSARHRPHAVLHPSAPRPACAGRALFSVACRSAATRPRAPRGGGRRGRCVAAGIRCRRG